MDIGKVRVSIDRIADCIPGVSTVTNMVDLFQKKVFMPTQPGKTDYYYTHLKQKSDLKCLLLAIPLVGQFLKIYDYFKSKGSAFSTDRLGRAHFQEFVDARIEKILDALNKKDYATVKNLMAGVLEGQAGIDLSEKCPQIETYVNSDLKMVIDSTPWAVELLRKNPQLFWFSDQQENGNLRNIAREAIKNPNREMVLAALRQGVSIRYEDIFPRFSEDKEMESAYTGN